MKVAIYCKRVPDEAVVSVLILVNELMSKNVQLYMNASFSDFLKSKNISGDFIIGSSLEDINTAPDILISVGGDGTILDTITAIGDSEIPIVGFNTGRLGFLANNAKEEAKQIVEMLLRGDYELEQRSLLSLKTDDKLFGNNNFALNELTVHKKDSSSMMTIHTYINDEYLNSYWADGLIIATPTGSTAYSLSCGGPILIPQSKNFVINPIAPHNLSARPIIVPDDVEIKLRIEGREDEFLATLDSRTRTISNDTDLKIVKSKFYINLVKFEGQNFYNTIRNKLLWGIDKRN
jgi:NAD+ kinase